jgi:hypothetical protein
MQAGGKSGLTKALEELTTLLPKALECCSGTEPSQNLPIVEKLRSVLLELIHGCLTCNAGELWRAAVCLACVTPNSRPAWTYGLLAVDHAACNMLHCHNHTTNDTARTLRAASGH